MKAIVITGSTRGIGLEMAKVFLSSGCKVTISGRRAVIPEETKNALAGAEASYIYIACNVQKKEDIKNLWNKVRRKMGTHRPLDKQCRAKCALRAHLGKRVTKRSARL